jgi:hypothetical protein
MSIWWRMVHRARWRRIVLASIAGRTSRRLVYVFSCSLDSNHSRRKWLVTDVSGQQRNACLGILTPSKVWFPYWRRICGSALRAGTRPLRNSVWESLARHRVGSDLTGVQAATANCLLLSLIECFRQFYCTEYLCDSLQVVNHCCDADFGSRAGQPTHQQTRVAEDAVLNRPKGVFHRASSYPHRLWCYTVSHSIQRVLI